MNHHCPFRKNLMQDLTASFLPGSRNKAGLLNKKTWSGITKDMHLVLNWTGENRLAGPGLS
jgi:hypothetical protein